VNFWLILLLTLLVLEYYFVVEKIEY